MRIRSIKPEFWKNETLAGLSMGARLLFIGLWNYADRDGRMEDRPKRIKAEILPYDDCDLGALLNELITARFIVRYGSYLAIVNFAKHQRPNIKELPSVIPAPTQHDLESAGTNPEFQEFHASMYPLPLNPDPVSSSPDLNPLDPNRSLETEPRPKPKRETGWPADLVLTDAMRTFANDRGVAPEPEFEAWRDDCLAHGRRYVDWEGAWRTRIRNAPKFAGRPQLALARGRPVAETPMDIAKRLVREAEDKERANAQ